MDKQNAITSNIIDSRISPNDLDLYLYKDGERFGFTDKSGNVVIPCIWNEAGDFQEGRALVVDDNKRCGFIDKSGNVVIPCIWNEAWGFQEGRALVMDDNKRLGFIDKTGKLVVSGTYNHSHYYRDGWLRIQYEGDDLYYFIDKKGKRMK